MVGTIELYPKEGSNNAYSNLKWRELSDTTTIKDATIINNMHESILVSGLSLESKESKTWYIALWLSEIDSDQRNIDKGEFQGSVKFEVNEEIGEGIVGVMPILDFVRDVMKDNAKSDENVDFSVLTSNSNTNGVYLKNDTKDDEYPIYYYRGLVNNNLIFADFCWKVIRTTDTGGVKLIYNGAPVDGVCNNSGNATVISKKKFNQPYNSLTYAGYMYFKSYVYSSKKLSTVSDSYVYGNDIEYVDGQYRLLDTISSNAWSSIYNNDIKTHHYTCLSTSNECVDGKVHYIYSTTSTMAYYITLENGNKVEDAINEMLGIDSYIDEDVVPTSSTVKGDKDTVGTVDWWYYNNIELAGYSSYLEDTVFCNERGVYQYGGWNPDGGDATSYLRFDSYRRAYSLFEPDLSCNSRIDSFSVSKDIGNGYLTYPVGLLTIDEGLLAGAMGGNDNPAHYLNSEATYWVAGANNFYNNSIVQGFITAAGRLNGSYAYSDLGIRPVISLKKGFSIENGVGTVFEPYVVIY